MRSWAGMTFSFGDDILRTVVPYVPPGHLPAAYEVREFALGIVRSMKAAGLHPHLADLPAPLHQPNISAWSDGYGPPGEIKWALVTVPAHEAQRAKDAGQSTGLLLDGRTGLLCCWTADKPSSCCPGCGSQLLARADSCPECHLRFIPAIDDSKQYRIMPPKVPSSRESHLVLTAELRTCANLCKPSN